MDLFFGIFLAIPLGLIPAFIAKKKGHSFGLWWLYGWALFIVAIIHVMFIEDRTVNQNYNNFNSNPNPNPYAYNQYNPTTAQPVVNKVAPVQNNVSSKNVAEELRALKELLDAGLITQDEFDTKKKQLLGL